VNPSTALATVLVDELVRCGLQEAVIAPGSRSAPLAMALHAAATGGRLRLHVRIDERSASFLALGLAKASGRPAAVLCTSGTAAAHFHAAVIEADEAGVPLLVLTADRPPELRGTGSNQTIDQIKLYGSAVRWFCEVGVPEDRPGQAGYWRSLADRAWAHAAGSGGGYPGPVHLNLPFRDPLVPDLPGERMLAAEPEAAEMAEATQAEATQAAAAPGGRAAGLPWTQVAVSAAPAPPVLELDWTERGLVLAGDGTAEPDWLVRLAAQAGWPLLAEPSSGARHGGTALSSYQYLLDAPGFLADPRPDVVVSAGRPGLTRGQLAVLRDAGTAGRHVVLLQGPGRWSDPARTATDVAGRLVLRGGPPRGARTGWLGSWLAADAAVRNAADRVLDAEVSLSEPRLARDLAAALPPGALIWAASSMPARDLDRHMAPRSDVRVLASRGASGIDGLVSTAIGAALAHQASGGGPAVALLGDLAMLHDAPGLVLGPAEPRPDLCVVVVNNDGGGIFSTLEQAAYPESFERVFGTPHGADFGALAGAAGLPYQRLDSAADLPAALAGTGLRVVEVRTDRSEGAKLRAAISQACVTALAVRES
jgi:2-succinyl-5-enolpyruvyl-6-hydroxy-3-cyclohexene-1-carboxylate synthase